MAENKGLTLTDRQRSPVASSRLPRTPMVGDARLNERIGSLKEALESILNGTEWPLEAKEAARGLITTVKSLPDIPNNTTSISQELQGVIQQYTQILEDVHSRLKDAASSSGMQKWKLLQRIKSLASNRSSKCALLFRTCQNDISKVLLSINECLDNERRKEDFVLRGILTETRTRPTVPSDERTPSPPSGDKTKPTRRVIASNDSTLSPPHTRELLLPEDKDSPGLIRGQALTIARKTFKGVEIASGSIPVVGSYFAAVSKVGLAFVETIETMDKNDDLSKDLGAETAKLCKLLSNFIKTPNADQGEVIADHVNDLQKELRHVHEKLNEWKSLGRFDKAFHSRDHAETLKVHQGTIQTAMEEMQLLAALDTRSIVLELKNSDVQEKQRRLLKCLGDGKYGARGNAVEDATCFPGTRVEILQRIDNWIRDSSTFDRVLWIRGMAGRGKSTIASTVVHNWRCRASCAIFHYRRGHNTLNTRVVCALARQLASSLVPEVRNAVLESVRENEDIADERLEVQFKTLFVTSLTKVNNRSHPILIVVDALDECDDPKDAVDFVRLLDRHSSSFPANVKFLLTSRPEARLLRALEPRQWRSEDLDTAPDVSGDLERFIQQACKQIRDSDPDVPKDWPSFGDVSRLVEMSQGLFQWARTAVTYVSNGSPVDRLRGLLKRSSTWSGLDDLYHQILSKAFETVKLDAEREDLLHRVLGTLAVAPYPVSLDVIAGLYGDNNIFNQADQADIILFLRKDILADLNSLLFIPLQPSEPIRLMHTSIHDLLISEPRCKQQSYYINVIRYHQQLATLCLETMLGHLKENICNLSDLSVPGSEVQDIVERDLSKAVVYCCRSWSIHLTEGVTWSRSGPNASTVKSADFASFSKERIMCWLEVMSLVGAAADAIIMAKRIYQWLLKCPIEESEFKSFATLWNDVQRFITMFSEPISYGPLHIYASALPHCPIGTEIWTLYGKHAKVRALQGHQTSTWPSNLWARSAGDKVIRVAFLPGGKVIASVCGEESKRICHWDTQTGTVISELTTGPFEQARSFCFSSDGKLLASASWDRTIRLWDPQTGTAVGEPLTGHSDWVQVVCFSPDGKLLASRSGDKTIRLWDPQTGTAVGEPLTDHDASAGPVCFSPDGKLLASRSHNKTIRLWDLQTGTAVGEPFTGHSASVHGPLCFSPDGKLLASGTVDFTIQLWDPQTRKAVGQPLEGHDGWVESLCFSPDGKLLASGSSDGSIRLWDPQTGATVGEQLTGHSRPVYSLCFSPDGRLLASGSPDHTVHLWDAQTGTATGEAPTDQAERVDCVCISPDGKLLASGSDDKTIRLWNLQTGRAVGKPLTGHTDYVYPVLFSPDGRLLASASNDQTIRLWDPYTGTAVGQPLTGHDGVNSICFSPDGKLLASGSYNQTIRLWNPRTGTTVGKPLTGHTAGIIYLCFSPDSEILASGSDDSTIRLWHTQTGMAIGEPLTGHTDTAYPLCFSPDGMVLASGGSSDHTIRLWNARTGAPLGQPFEDHAAYVNLLCFSSDGIFLMARYSDGYPAMWDVATQQRSETPRSLLARSNPGFQDHWITFLSSRFFWLPSQYWCNPRDIILSGTRLIVLCGGTVSIFDVSQMLDV